MRKLLILLGVPIDDLNMTEALDRLEEFIAIGRQTSKSHQVATINADFVVNSLHDPELCRILQESDMATADGMPLVWGARLLGVPLSGRVTGADMVPALAERAAQKGYSMYFLGARPGVAAQAADILRTRHPNLQIVGISSPPNRSVLEMDRSVLEEVQAARPDILLVAFGNPKQEKWISMHLHELQVPVCIGVGGTFDLIAGVTRRAPVWMQRIGMEWLYRLLQEPRRLWKRYVHDMVYFGYFFIHQLWQMRKGHQPSPLVPISDTVMIEKTAIIHVKGRIDIHNREAFMKRAEEALRQSPFLAVNLAAADFLDSSALGALVALANRARQEGGRFWLVAVPRPIAQVLEITRLDKFFEIHTDLESTLVARHSAPPPVTQPDADSAGWLIMKMPRVLDGTTTPTMLEKCTQSLDHSPRLILDFSETVFLSSAGMAAMIKLDRELRERGGALRIAGCSHDVLRTIQLVKLDTLLPLFRDVSTAMAA